MEKLAERAHKEDNRYQEQLELIEMLNKQIILAAKMNAIHSFAANVCRLDILLLSKEEKIRNEAVRSAQKELGMLFKELEKLLSVTSKRR